MLWDDFLNSEYHDWRGTGKSEDRLDKPEWRSSWLRQHGLPDPGTPSAEEIRGLKTLRSSMMQMVRDIAAGALPGAESVAALNGEFEHAPFVYRLDRVEDGLRLRTVRLRQDWAGVRAEIAESFARALAEGEPERFRICENPDCLWVYYDETRNRSKRFCDDKLCGNLMKVRRFRARKKAAESGRGSEKN